MPLNIRPPKIPLAGSCYQETIGKFRKEQLPINSTWMEGKGYSVDKSIRTTAADLGLSFLIQEAEACTACMLRNNYFFGTLKIKVCNGGLIIGW